MALNLEVGKIAPDELMRAGDWSVNDSLTNQNIEPFLKVLAKFPYETLANLALITEQNPEMTQFIGKMRAKKLGQPVKSDAKGVALLDSIRSFVHPDENNTGRIEESLSQIVVWKYSMDDTEGNRISPRRFGVEINNDNVYDFLACLTSEGVTGVPMELVEPSKMNSREQCYYDPRRQKLFVRNDLEDSEVAKAVIHGVSQVNENANPKFVEYCVRYYFGMDTSDIDLSDTDEIFKGMHETYEKMGAIEPWVEDTINETARMVSDITSGVRYQMELQEQRNELDYTNEAQVFGVPVLYKQGSDPPEKIPEGMYAYKLVASDFQFDPPKTGTIGHFEGPYCLTSADNDSCMNVMGTIISPAYITLNERNFLKLNNEDIQVTERGRPVQDALLKINSAQKNQALQNRIIRANEDVLWADHGKRIAVYVPLQMKDCVSYDGRNGRPVDVLKYRMAYGTRLDAGETLNDVIGHLSFGSEDRPVDYKGISLTAGMIVVENTGASEDRVFAGYLNDDGTLTELPNFSSERAEGWQKHSPQMNLSDYCKDGGLVDSWSAGSEQFVITGRPDQEGYMSYMARAYSPNGGQQTKSYDKQCPARNAVMKDCGQPDIAAQLKQPPIPGDLNDRKPDDPNIS